MKKVMKKNAPKRDWAEATAERIVKISVTSSQMFKNITSALRRARKLNDAERKEAEKRGYERASVIALASIIESNVDKAELLDIKVLAKSLSKFVEENGYGGDGEWKAYFSEYQAENWLRNTLLKKYSQGVRIGKFPPGKNKLD